MKKHFWKITLAVVVVLMGASFAYAHYISTKANEGVVIVPHIQGDQNSKVKLTEYGDFQCPACGQFYPIVKQVLEKHGSDITFEFKNFPLLTIHPFALPAAKAAEAAGQQGKYFEMYDKLYTNQDTWSKSATPEVYFLQYAKDLGLDIALFKQHIKASAIEDHIKDQFNEARGLGLTGTPSFYLNGEKMEFQTLDDFTGAIDAALGITSTSTATTESSSGVEFGIPGAGQ